MIEVEELMLNDWVYDGIRPVQVTSTSILGGPVVGTLAPFSSVEHIYADNVVALANGAGPLKLLSPIRITKGVLEQMGWTPGSYSTYKIDENLRLEYYHYENRFRKIYEGVDEWQNHAKVREVTHESQCIYLHELQRSLRSCGMKSMANALIMLKSDGHEEE